MNDLRHELAEMRLTLGLRKKVYCSKEEENKLLEMIKDKLPLPDDIKTDGHEFYRYVDTDLSEQEIKQLILYRQTADLRSIKNSMTFIVVIAIVSIIISLIIALT